MDDAGAMPTGGPDLSDAGMDMSNYTVASDFLTAILDDTGLQPYDWAITGAFWYGILVVLAISAIVNLIRWTTLKARIRAAAAKHPRPAKASNWISSSLAALTTVVREVSYPHITPSRSKWFRVPPFGAVILILSYLGFIFGLQFYHSDYHGAQYWEAIGLRASWLTVAQFPLLLLLAGKNNLVGLFAGVSYERLQILHRWVARAMLLTATLHGAYQAYGWDEYGVLQIEINTDSCVPTGFATWILLLWLIFSSMTPFRNLRYEFFVVQHLISFIGFLVAIFYHIPSYALNARIFIWFGISFFLLDRLIRFSRSVINNRKPGQATLTSLPGGVTRISVRSPTIKKWKPGQHVFLCLPRFGLGQSHPATIASVPSSHGNELVFFLRAHKGFTKRILGRAVSASTESLLSQTAITAEDEKFTALVDGPYGASYSDFAAFDTAVLIAGSTGVTFTLPILLDIAHRGTTNRLPVRSLVFIWMVKSTDRAVWIVNELQKAFETLHAVGVEVEIKIFVTCDPSMTESSDDSRKCDCDCDVRLGPCCCETPLEDDISPAPEKPRTSSNAIKPNEAIAITEKIEPIAPSPALNLSRQASVGLAKPVLRSGNRLKDRLQKFATLQSGRPNFKSLLWEVLDKAQGETGVAVCGPAGLSSTVRNTVAAVSDQRGAAKGTGADGIYLHSECYYW